MDAKIAGYTDESNGQILIQVKFFRNLPALIALF
jgi:hypothetical protein